MSNWRGTNPELVNNKIRRSKYNWILRHIYLVDEMGWYWWWLLLVPRSLTLKASYFQNGVENFLKLHFFHDLFAYLSMFHTIKKQKCLAIWKLFGNLIVRYRLLLLRVSCVYHFFENLNRNFTWQYWLLCRKNLSNFSILTKGTFWKFISKNYFGHIMACP